MISNITIIIITSIVLSTILFLTIIIHDYRLIKDAMLEAIEAKGEVLKVKIDKDKDLLILDNRSPLSIRIVRFYVIDSNTNNVNRYDTDTIIEPSMKKEIDLNKFKEKDCIKNDVCSIIALSSRGNRFSS